MNPKSHLKDIFNVRRIEFKISTDNQLIEEERMRSEENIYNTHTSRCCQRKGVTYLEGKREGEMITTLERAIKNEEDYDMREYQIFIKSQ